jgi:hypothetical protein
MKMALERLQAIGLVLLVTMFMAGAFLLASAAWALASEAVTTLSAVL